MTGGGRLSRRPATLHRKARAVPAGRGLLPCRGARVKRNGAAAPPPSSYVSDFLTTSEGLELIKAFIEIKDPKVRRKLVDLAKALGQAG